MSDAPPGDLVPVTKASAVSSSRESGPPNDLVPVAKTDTNLSSTSPPRDTAMTPIKNLPKDIWHDFHSGLDTIADAMRRNKKEGASFAPGLAVPEAVLGTAQALSAPVTGSYKALIGDPIRKLIPQDTVAGKMFANTVDDAVLLFGPEALGDLSAAAKQLKSASGPTISAVRNLMDNGVQLTPGMISSKIGKRMEEAAKSLPLAGSFIRRAEERALDSFNVATVNKALTPIGAKIEAKDAREALTKAHDIADQKYAEVRASVPSLRQDMDFQNDITALHVDLTEMDQSVADRVRSVLKNRVDTKFDTMLHTMDGNGFKTAESELTKLVNENRFSPDQKNREFAQKVNQIRDAMRDALARQYPEIADKLKDVNQAYSQLADLDVAASRRVSDEARFTPNDLLQALRRKDRTPRHMKFNEGRVPLQSWAEDANTVMTNTLKDSGTAERIGWAVAEGGAYGGAAIFDPMFLSALGGVAGVYSRPGISAVNDLASNAPAVAQTLGIGAMRGAAPANAAEQFSGQK